MDVCMCADPSCIKDGCRRLRESFSKAQEDRSLLSGIKKSPTSPAAVESDVEVMLGAGGSEAEVPAGAGRAGGILPPPGRYVS